MTYITLLRGINVGGRKIIKMEALRELFADLACENVQTYIQSGNIIFHKTLSSQKDFQREVATAILSKFGFEVPVILMDLEQLMTCFKDNPFLNDATKNNDFLHLTFLSDIPDKEKWNAFDLHHYLPDEAVLIHQTVYLYCPNGYQNTKLSNNFLEKKLKMTATTRNLHTVNALIELANR